MATCIWRNIVGLCAALAFPASASADELVDATGYPWSAVGRVNFSGGGYCSGTLVAPSLVLTSAHCMYAGGSIGWVAARQVRFAAGYNFGSAQAETGVVDFRVSAGFDPFNKTEIKNMTYDWALLTLERALGDEVGYLGVIPLERGGLERLRARADGFARAGYGGAGGMEARADLGCAPSGFFGDIDLLVHQCEVNVGDSGGPILVRLGTGFAVIGVQSGRAESRSFRYGTAVPAETFYQSIAFTATGQAAGAAALEGYAGLPPLLARVPVLPAPIAP